MLAVVSAGAAGGSTVADVTVTQSTPVTGAGSNYDVTFDTSPTGALSPGATINLDLPNGTNGASLTSDTHVIDDTTGEFQGGCSETNGTALVVCDVNGANEIGAGDAVSVFLDGIVNPSTPSTSDTISVETSADNGAPVASNAYAIEAAQSVSGVAVSQAQSTANATSDYTVFFTASSSGAMAPGSGDSITLTFPGGFDVDALSSAGVLDGTEPVGLCSSSASTVTCPVADSPIRDGDVVEVRLNGVVNPPSTGTYVVGVQTSADNQTAVDGPVTIGPGQEVSDVTVSQTSPVTGAHSDYLVTFDLSSTGGLSAGDTVTLAFPQGTDLTSLTSTELGAPGNIAGSCADSTTTTATCSVSGSLTGGSQVGVSLDGVVNPPTAAANDTVGVETSVDDAGVVSSNGFAITADQEVSAVMASPAVPVAGAVSGYAISFDTSPTGEMAGGAGDTVTLSFPSGTGLDAMTSAEMTMNGEFVGNCPDSTSTTLSCVVEGAIAAGAEVSVALSGVINPDTAGADTVSVETSADNAGPVESPAFVLENPQPAVTAVGPTTGPAAGGNTVTVAGSDLQGASGVLFGTVPATDVEVNATGAQLTAIAPGTSGVLPSTVDVTVTTPSGTSARSSVDHYEYLPAPAISGVSPASGKAGGGARVTIAGTGFLGGQVEVAFGSRRGHHRDDQRGRDADDGRHTAFRDDRCGQRLGHHQWWDGAEGERLHV